MTSVEPFVLESTIEIPSAVSSLVFGPENTLCVGSDDGSVRWYNLPSARVTRAIRKLGHEISSLAWTSPKKDEEAVVWIASGRQAFSFPAVSAKMITMEDDAISSLILCEDDDDVLNELCLSENAKMLAFSTDSGTVGVVDLVSKNITRMKSRHDSICGSVKFIPGRPSEIVSGGYDSALLHFDIGQGSILSRHDIAAPPPSEGMILSPSFVLSVSVSSTGLVAASTADGRVWVGGGGEKRPGAKKKRTRKWEGLKEGEGIWLQVADGPVVSTAFNQNDRLITCSLLGVLTEYSISRDSVETLQATKERSAVTKTLEKVNAIASHQNLAVLGGFSKDGKGLVEVWCAQQRLIP